MVKANTPSASVPSLMNVRKRNGSLEPVDINKILRAVTRCADGISDVDPYRVAIKTIGSIVDGATTSELDRKSIETAASLIPENPNYSKLAAAILAEYIRKDVHRNQVRTFSESITAAESLGMVSREFRTLVTENARKLDNAVKDENNRNFEYYGLKSICDHHLLRNPEGGYIETPQYFLMREAIHRAFEGHTQVNMTPPSAQRFVRVYKELANDPRAELTLLLPSPDDDPEPTADIALNIPPISFRPLKPGMGQAVAERTILRRNPDGTWENWGQVATRVALGNSSLYSTPTHPSSREFEILRKHIAHANTLMSGRHLQHGDADQPQRNMEVFTNCATSATSFLLFYLLLNGSGVGRCYDDDMMLVNWDTAPNIRCVLDEAHPDFIWGVSESVREARHKYGAPVGMSWFEIPTDLSTWQEATKKWAGTSRFAPGTAHRHGQKVLWLQVPDSREGWAKALEAWEMLAFEKIHNDTLLILDFSQVRPKNVPIGGMQNRPASGPVPLMNAFLKAASMKGAGMAPWKQALYTDHYFAECVLVGGARRAARMSTKFWSDPNILDFIRVKSPLEFLGLTVDESITMRRNKQYSPFLWSSNNSVAVDDEFWTHVTGFGEESNPRRQLAKAVFEAVCANAYGSGTGEPGFINVHKLTQNDEGWSDLNRGDYVDSEKYKLNEDTQILMSRLAKRAKKKKYHMITNPSLRAGTKVLTSEGVFPIQELEGKHFQVKNLNGKFSPATCWLSSPKETLYKVRLSSGFEYFTTAQHKWPVILHFLKNSDTQLVKLRTDQLEAGMWLPTIPQQTSLFPGGAGTYNEGFLIGWNLGDGWITQRTDTGETQYGFCTYEDDKSHGLDKKLSSILESFGWEGSFEGINEINTTRRSIHSLFTSTGTFHKSKGLPKQVWTGSDEFRHGVVDGMFSSDGSFSKGKLTLTTAHRVIAEDMQELLGFYGIKSKWYPGTTHLNGQDFPRFDLKVDHQRSLAQFAQVFPLSHARKQASLERYVARQFRGNTRLATRIKIESVEKTEISEPVWDIRVDDEYHCFQLSQCITGNCGEIVLNLLGGFCVIVDGVPYHCDTLDEAEDMFRAVTRAMIRVNLMNSVYTKEVRRTNRIGIGMTGVHEFAWKFFGYGFRDLINEEKSKDFWLTLSRFNRAIREEAIHYSKELGLEEPHTKFTIKPAGTTSKLFGLTEGWHLPAMIYYLRWVQFRSDDPLVAEYRNNGYPTRDLRTYEGTTIVGFPTAPTITELGMGDKLVTAAEATPEEQFQWLMLGEKYWINGTDEQGTPLDVTDGNQISYTLKYDPKTVDYEQFRAMILQYQPQVRCCSVMPQEDTSAYEYLPEETISAEDFARIQAGLERSVWKKSELREEIGREHVGCDSGACPVDFNSGKK